MTSQCKCHELRQLTEHCEDLADAVDAGQAPPEHLIIEIARLRTSFDEHRRSKHHEPGTFGAEDHFADAFPMRLGRELGPTSELRLVLSAMRSYLAIANQCAVRAPRTLIAEPRRHR